MTTPENAPPFRIDEDQPTGWFETLYSGVGTDGAGVPWANMTPHPSLLAWLSRNPVDGRNKTALVVGCGMGDDAITLESLGFSVTAFDVSDSAVALCRDRFPNSGVNFCQADLLQPRPDWHRAFDFVLEIFTIQALPPKYEAEVIDAISGFVAPGGQLLVISDTANRPRAFENGPPWLLTPDHAGTIAARGLVVENQTVEASDFEGSDNLMVTSFRRPAS